MKLLRALALPPLAVALAVGGLAPAEAAATDPVADLSVVVVQKTGTTDSWRISASWTANPDATSYSVLIADHADGTVTPGKVYGNKDTAGTAVDLVASNLSAGVDYWVAVQPIAPASGEVAVMKFTPPALDVTAPDGSFTLSRTSAFLSSPDLFEEDDEQRAKVSVLQSSVDADAVSRSVVAGDGSAARPWASGTSFALTYTRAGRFTPVVRLADEFGNTREIALPTVWVRVDNIAPVLRITRPAKPTAAASWRVIRGTATDVGNGVVMVGTFVVEKRGRKWWAYDFRKRRWLAGYATQQKTIARTKARPAFMVPSRSGAWQAPAIRGLTRGVLHVEAMAFDEDFNLKLVKLDQRVR